MSINSSKTLQITGFVINRIISKLVLLDASVYTIKKKQINFENVLSLRMKITKSTNQSFESIRID
jgi:hypothetical protein